MELFLLIYSTENKKKGNRHCSSVGTELVSPGCSSDLEKLINSIRRPADGKQASNSLNSLDTNSLQESVQSKGDTKECFCE